MVEILGGGLLGSLLGGLFRLAPEVLKFFDKKNEREHELRMFDRQCELEKVRGTIRLEEIGAQRDAAVDTGLVGAFTAAINQQAEMVKAAKGWAATLSASVRPVITYWIIFLWSFVHIWFAFSALSQGASAREVFTTMMTTDFVALVSGTTNYWFLDRTLKQRGL